MKHTRGISPVLEKMIFVEYKKYILHFCGLWKMERKCSIFHSFFYAAFYPPELTISLPLAFIENFIKNFYEKV